jgi:hypothetical protein
MLLLLLSLMASSTVDHSSPEVADLRAALLGRPPAPYQQRYRKTGGILSEANGVTRYRWVERRGGTSMSYNGDYSSTALSYCQVEATVKDGLIVEVMAHGDTRMCSHMFSVMKRLK